MSERIKLAPANGKVVVRAGGAVIAESTRAVCLSEEGYEPVYYIPREDVGMAFLDRSEHRTQCPHKGEATHFHVAAKSGRIANAAWSYEAPAEGLEAIRGMLAFYPGKAAVELF